jgi:hypothetical protein
LGRNAPLVPERVTRLLLVEKKRHQRTPLRAQRVVDRRGAGY